MARLRLILVPGLCTLVVAAILVALGVWQLKRLAWKDALIAQVEARSKAAPVALPPPSAWPTMTPPSYEFRHVWLDGTFINTKETLILRASADGAGYHVITPLLLKSGGTVLVDRGFVPASLKDPSTRAAGEIAGEVHLTGLLRAPEPRNVFTPADDPAQGQFYTRDPVEIATAEHLREAAPFSVDVDPTVTNPGGWPKPTQAELSIPNNHFSYAITWFGLALGLCGVFVSYAWPRLTRGAPHLQQSLHHP